MEIIKENVHEIVNEMDRRNSIVQGMYLMASVKWSPSEDFFDVTKATVEGTREPYTNYKKGEVYYGLPFTKRNKTSVVKFCDAVTDGVLSVPQECIEVLGADCTSSMIISMLKYADVPIRYLTKDFLHDRKITETIDNIEIKEEDKFSNLITKRYSKEYFYETYAKLKIGDIASSRFFRDKSRMTDHTRLITGETHVAYDKNGNIDGDSSYVIITENTAVLSDTMEPNNYGGCITFYDYVVPFVPDIRYTDLKSFRDLRGKKTNFRVNRKISFSSLFANHYIPLTFTFYCV